MVTMPDDQRSPGLRTGQLGHDGLILWLRARYGHSRPKLSGSRQGRPVTALAAEVLAARWACAATPVGRGDWAASRRPGNRRGPRLGARSSAPRLGLQLGRGVLGRARSPGGAPQTVALGIGEGVLGPIAAVVQLRIASAVPAMATSGAMSRNAVLGAARSRTGSSASASTSRVSLARRWPGTRCPGRSASPAWPRRRCPGHRGTASTVFRRPAGAPGRPPSTAHQGPGRRRW